MLGLAVESVRHHLSVGPERNQRASLIEDEFGKEAAVAAFDVDDRFQFVIECSNSMLARASMARMVSKSVIAASVVAGDAIARGSRQSA
jgi:hypothetical protein